MMMQAQEKKPNWDFELYPMNGQEVGEIEFLRIDVKAGQTAIICAYSTVLGRGYIYDGRSCGLFYLSYQNSVINQELEIMLEIPKDGYLYFSGHYQFHQENKDDIVTGKYIKIRIE